MNDLFNNDAEVALLSIILKDPSAVYDITDVKSFMLSSEINKNLLDTLVTLLSTGVTPDYNLFLYYLKSSSKLNECGGESYISYLYNQDYNKDYLKDFERLVVNSFKARTLISISNQIPTIVKNQNDVDSAINYVRDNLDSLSSLEGGGKTVDLKQASRETWTDLVERVNSGAKIETTSGFKHIDAITYGYEPGDLWVVAGRPGMGKSAMAVNSIIRCAKVGIPSLLISREMRRKSLVHRILAIETGIPIYNIHLGMLNQKQLDLIAEKIKEIKDYPIHIDTNFSGNLNYVFSTIRRYKKIYDIQVVHVDYLQILVERSTEMRHDLGQATRGLKLLAEEIEVCSVAYSQLNRELERRPDKRPILSDLKESGTLEDDADVVMFLYRDELYNRESKHKGEMEHIIAKQRNGPIGTVFSKFDKETNRITEG